MTGTRAEMSQAASNVVHPQAQARVYAITRQEASTAPQVITGMVSLCDRMVCALIDPGATHSFIAYQLANSLGLPYGDMDNTLYVRTPLGKM